MREVAIPLTSGTRLEPYEILDLLGSGGMGEVYRARDVRLGREVALKLLFASSAKPDRVARFEQEARAAGALNHPNILVVFDVGTHEGAPYVVSELLEGETLRQRMREGPLPPRKALEYAVQIADGLAAAHEKGIYHRDLKPENVFVTTDGRVKILDFGLAKLAPPGPSFGPSAPTLPLTEPGTILGTVGYMAPEQVRGLPTDHRSDIFSFGAVLYEMLSGRRAFTGGSPIEAMSAILKEDPPPFADRARALPPGLERIVRHCLEKRSEERFQSVRDLAFDLREAQGQWVTSEPAGAPWPIPGRGWLRPLLAALATAALVAASLLAARALWERPVPTFRQLTFRRGTILSARFAPEAHAILYAAAWEGKPSEVFLAYPGGPESRSLGYPGAKLVAASSAGEMAISLGYRYAGGERFRGTLARAPWGGGAAREVLEDVEDADWSPDGSNLAVVRSAGVGTPSRLEYPVGTLLYETNGSIRDPRISADGERVAFLDDPVGLRANGSVAIVDRTGTKRTLTRQWAHADGLAWSAAGNAVWFTAAEEERTARNLHAVSLSGAERLVAQVPGSMALQDIARDGRVLLTHDQERHGILGLPPGETTERELSWFDESAVTDLSADGGTLLFGDRRGVYVRKADGSPAVRLGEGYADALSPDGKWALVTTVLAKGLMLLPTGPGEPRPVPRHTIASYAGAWWFSDGKRILFNGREPDRRLRAYVQSLEGGAPRPVTPEGTWALSIAPDQKVVAAIAQGQGISFYPLEGGPPVPVRGSEPGDRPAGWSADGRWLWIFRRGETPAPVYRLDLSTGRRELWKSFAPSDPAGVSSVTEFRITPDGKSYVYSYRRILSDLYLAEGLR